MYSPLIIIPLILLGAVSNRIASKEIINKTMGNVSDNSKLIITRIEGILDNAENCGNMLSINLNRSIVINEEYYRTGLLSLKLYNSLSNELSYAKLIFPDVESGIFLSNDFTAYSSDDKLLKQKSKVIDSNIIKEIDKSNGINIWFPMEKRDFMVMNANEPVLTLGKKIIDSLSGNKLGYLVLNIPERTISSIYEDMGIVEGGRYIVVDNDGKVVSSQDKDEILETVEDEDLRDYIVEHSDFCKILSLNKTEYIVSSHDFRKGKYKLVGIIPLEELLKDSKKISYFIFALSIICVIFVIVGSLVLSKVISKPIVDLKNKMVYIQSGNLDVEFENFSKDEIGLLSYGFQQMIFKVKELMVKFEDEHKKKREIELTLLHAQIKPHFLYNTLDVIYALSELGRPKDVQKTTKALADYYRIVLSKGEELISIRDEMKNVNDYLSIQKLRYSDVFDYEIDVDTGIKEYIISKLTIQPLIENAIYHGLKNKPTFGKLKISGFIEDKNIVIKVWDNGTGISKKKVKMLFIQSLNSKKSFGLHNVDERLRIIFGEQYGLNVVSEENEYTEVSITIPMIREGEKNV